MIVSFSNGLRDFFSNLIDLEFARPGMIASDAGGRYPEQRAVERGCSAPVIG
jgi:hypothetical protein